MSETRSMRAFSLIEVILAIGVVGASVVAVVVLFTATARMATELNDGASVRKLADEVKFELERVRDVLPTSGSQTRLEQLASRLASDGLRLVADRELRRLRVEAAADTADGIPLRNRFYLVEIQSHQGDLAPQSGAGFLAISVRVSWPYWLPTGPAGDDATLVAPEHIHRAFFNLALTP